MRRAADGDDKDGEDDEPEIRDDGKTMMPVCAKKCQ